MSRAGVGRAHARARVPLTAAALAALAALACALASPAAVQALAVTQAQLSASFAPARAGASAALRLGLKLAGEEPETPPPPLRAAVFELPQGTRVHLAGTATCARAALASGGPSRCPRRSLLGRGHAELEVHAGSQTIPEQAQVALVRAPDRGGRAAMWLFSRGDTPLQQQTIAPASLAGDGPPYGVRVSVSFPPIPTLVYEPDASVISLALTVGGAAAPTLVSVPSGCPAGALRFAAALSFAGAAGVRATAQQPCASR